MSNKFVNAIKSIFGPKYTPPTPVMTKPIEKDEPKPEPVKKSEPIKKAEKKPEKKPQPIKPAQQGNMWSAEEIALFDKGLSNIDISKKTGRSLEAVKRKRSRLKK